MGELYRNCPAHRSRIPSTLKISVFLQTIRMKLLVLISLVTLSFAFEDGKMVKYWEKMKAAESCWGEENFKQHMISFKKACAKCGQEDAPELSLPPFRSTYRFVNTLLNGANDMENRQANMMYRMMESMMKNKYNSYSDNDGENSYGNNDRQTRMKMFMTMMRAMMGNNMNDNNYNYRSNNHTAYTAQHSRHSTAQQSTHNTTQH